MSDDLRLPWASYRFTCTAFVLVVRWMMVLFVSMRLFTDSVTLQATHSPVDFVIGSDQIS